MTVNHEKCLFNKSRLEFSSQHKVSQLIPRKWLRFSTLQTPRIQLIVNGSPIGLGAILCRKDGKEVKYIMAYTHRSLNDVEERYSQMEKEVLAIIWSCKHFHRYIYGHPFTLVTDHKALEIIWNNSKSKPPARIERSHACTYMWHCTAGH